MRHLPLLATGASNTRCDFVLDALEVQTPCDVSWNSMKGDNRVRYCGHCRQNVYNIEALPRAEAVRLIGEREGRLCVRFHRRPDGTVVTADCWARLRAARRKGWLAFAAMLVIVGTAQLFAMLTGLSALRRLGTQGAAARPAEPVPAGQAAGRPAPAPGRDVIMGEIAFPPEPVRSAAAEPRHLMGKPAPRDVLGRLPRR